MAILTSRERMLRTFRHQEIDRIMMVDSAWGGTIQRWHNEGMPTNVWWEDYFDFDKVVRIHPDNSPRYPFKLIEETDRHRAERVLRLSCP